MRSNNISVILLHKQIAYININNKSSIERLKQYNLLFSKLLEEEKKAIEDQIKLYEQSLDKLRRFRSLLI